MISFRFVRIPRFPPPAPPPFFVGGFNKFNRRFFFFHPPPRLPAVRALFFAASCEAVEITGGYDDTEGVYTEEGTRNGAVYFISTDRNSELFFSSRDDERRRSRRLTEDVFGELVLYYYVMQPLPLPESLKKKKMKVKNAFWVLCFKDYY